MADAFIVDACRTPIGRYGGSLSSVRPDDLAAVALRGIVDRSGIDPARIDDVIFGCVNQAGEDNRNVARMALLLAGYPVSVPGQTVNRLCGSGLQAVVTASHAIRAGEGDVFVGGGVESMSRSPWVTLKPDSAYARGAPEVADSLLGWRFVNPKMPAEWTISMGETAEEVAEHWSCSREEQDAFAARSQRLAGAALENGAFREEIVPVPIPQKGGTVRLVETDEHPRPETTVEGLSALRPAFKKTGGTVTAGNSSGLNDGAAAVLIVSERSLEDGAMRPLARIVATAVAGVDPKHMGIGPVPASRLALKRAGLDAAELDLVELNEAFAAQAGPCVREIGVDPEIVNVTGGAIALGHPLGCSGARILTTLVHGLRRSGGRYGLATMCIGVGQGIAMIVENVSNR
jgi:3-oxoadipyl-CoA thiolase